MIRFIKKFSHWLLPPTCILCRNFSHQSYDLCLSCSRELPILEHNCLRCTNIIPLSEKDRLCGQCIKCPPPFDYTYALFAYQPPITRLILHLKFQHALTNARLLGELLAEKIQQDWYREKSLPDVIIPIPLHKKRLRERGFNQALEIARFTAKKLHLPIDASSSLRTKPTLAQTTLSAKERQKNLRGAFLIKENFRYQKVAVIDDVITTGHTMMAFCQALKNQGAAQIDVWCCARAIDNTPPTPTPPSMHYSPEYFAT